VIAATLAGLMLTACSDAPTTLTTRIPDSDVLATTQISPRALIMAAGATQQLTLTAFALDSTVLSTYDTVTYASSDSLRVQVSPTGLITAATGPKAPTSGPVRVVASVVRSGITRADTAYVAVVATAGTNPTFTLADPSADTIKVPFNSTRTAIGTVTYFDGTSTVTMPPGTVPIRIQVSDPSVALTSSATQFFTYAAEGTVTISGTTTVFGTPLSSSYTYQLGNPLRAGITLYPIGAKILQGTATSTAGYERSAVLKIQPGGLITIAVYLSGLSAGKRTVGVTCTADDGGSAPAPAIGLTYGGSLQFTRPGSYSCDWTNDGVLNFPTDGSLHFSVLAQ
jgi:hypothetical protein